MRIADVDGRNGVIAAVDSYFLGNLAYFRFSHIDADGIDLSVAQIELKSRNAACGFNGHFFLFNYTLVIQILADAAQIVAGGFALAAVLIERTHFRVGNVGFFN